MSYKTKLRLPEAETGYYKGWHPTVEIEIKDTDEGPELSMSGSIGSKRNGIEGQIDETLAEAFPNNLHVQRIVEVWRKYHLNYMKAGCEHQHDWPTSTRVTVWNWTLDVADPDMRAAHDVERKAHATLRATGSAELDATSRALLSQPHQLMTITPDRPTYYKPAKFTPVTETKTLGWLRPDEHPDGLLCKPCDVCGYEYGSAWRYMPIPAAILDEIRSWN